jgi:hypothetical protein
VNPYLRPHPRAHVCDPRKLSMPVERIGYAEAVCRECGQRMQAVNGEIIWYTLTPSPVQVAALQTMVEHVDARLEYVTHAKAWRVHTASGYPLRTVARPIKTAMEARGWIEHARDRRGFVLTRAGRLAYGEELRR